MFDFIQPKRIEISTISESTEKVGIFSSKPLPLPLFLLIYLMCDAGRGNGRPEKFRNFPENGGPKRFFIAYIPDVAAAMRVEDANEGLATTVAKNRIFPHEFWDEPPLIFVYRSRGGLRRLRGK